jgi:hypothetical protein
LACTSSLSGLVLMTLTGLMVVTDPPGGVYEYVVAIVVTTCGK